MARTKATVGALLERWMVQHEIDPKTRMTYEAQIGLYSVVAATDDLSCECADAGDYLIIPERVRS